MSHRLPKIYLVFLAIILLVFGVLSLVITETLFAQAGIVAKGATGLSELRAVYGGLEIGLAIVLILAVAGHWPIRAALMVCAILFTALALARIGSAVSLGEFSSWTNIGIAFEILAAAGGWWFWMQAKR